MDEIVSSNKKIRYHGKPLVQIYCRNKDKSNISRTNLMKRAEEIRVEMNQRSQGKLLMMLTVHVKDIGWRSGRFLNVSKKGIVIWEPDEYGLMYGHEEDVTSQLNEMDKKSKIDYAIFQFVPDVTKMNLGTDDKNNDCVYECLKAYKGKLLHWKSAEKFKTCFDLKRKQKFPIEMFEKVEEHTSFKEWKINVKGKTDEESYVSTKKAKYEINLINNNGHCEIAPHSNYNTKFATGEKNVYFYTEVDGKVYAFSHNNGSDRCKEYNCFHFNRILKKHKENPDDYETIYIKADENMKKYGKIREQWERWNEDHQILLKESKGKINMRKTGMLRQKVIV